MKHFYPLFVFLFLSGTVSAQIFFEERASQLGLDDTSYGNGILGGGVSFFDFDNDGWDDITMATEDGSLIRLFKNNEGVFEEVSLNITDHAHQSKTVQWVDINNNGLYDLFITHDNAPNRLYKNLGNMIFEDITMSSGLFDDNHISFGASWGDVNNDGFLDVFIASRNVSDPTEHNLLFLNNGDETFTDITVSAGLHLENKYSFCVAFFDYDKDGFQDIYIANDKFDTANILYKNNGDNTFTDVSAVSGTDVIIDAMSTTIDDYNNDGWLDIYITNTPTGNVFYKNNGDGTFTDVAVQTGTTFDSVGWGAVFLDADHDGHKDLYVVGEVFDSPSLKSSAFYHNNGDGTFSIPTNSGIFDEESRSFANAIGDINNNGHPDIAVLNFSPFDMYLWENQSTTTHNWLKVKLEGTESNRQGIGSWIEISVNGEKQHNYTLLGEGFLGQNSSYEFFGIGESASIDYVKVTWLSGIVDYIENPAINEHMTIVEGEHILSADTFISINKKVSLFPNPSKDFATLKLPDFYDLEKTRILIKNSLGQEIEQFEPKMLAFEINTSNYKTGIYFCIINSPQGQETLKLIKQ
tara:strand:- start:170944 stop:172683 length:1740 start_codon:yes stop_codon:yes gene_type:complete